MWTLSFYFSTFGVLIILLFVLVYKCNFEHGSNNHQIKNSPNIYIRKDLEPATVKSFCPLNSFNLIWLKFNSETEIQISQLNARSVCQRVCTSPLTIFSWRGLPSVI